jgi:outer membrane immunogenic protein
MRILKLTLATFAALAGLTVAASAADLGHRGSYKDEPIVAPVYAWNGVYIGGNLGAAFFDDDFGDDDDTILIGGVHVGFNRQIDRLVVGLEADVNFAEDIDYLASVRARLGAAVGDTFLRDSFLGNSALIYLTAGYAWGEDDFGVEADGFVGGVGIEKMLRENVSLGLEGLYYALETDDRIFRDEDVDFFTLRARLTFHLSHDRHHDAMK